MTDPTILAWAGRIVEASGLREGQTFLDIGGGDGALCEAIMESSGAEGTVLDAKVPDDSCPVPRVLGDALDLPFSSGLFDAVVMSRVLHHVGSPRQAISEAARVLAVSGTLCVRSASHADLRSVPLRTMRKAGTDHTVAQILDSTPDTPVLLRWIKQAGLTDARDHRVTTDSGETLDEWIHRVVLLEYLAWAVRGVPGPDPRPEIEAELRREFTAPPPARETLIVARRACPGVP